MTVSTTANRISYAGDGSTVAFSYPYSFQSEDDLVVVLVSSADVETTQTLTTHYSVSGTAVNNVYPNGGTVTMVTAPASGETLVIYRDAALTQSTDYVSADPFPAETHEQGLDRLTMIAQRTREMVSQAVRVPEAEASVARLPALTDRKGKYAYFNATTGALEALSAAAVSLLDGTPLFDSRAAITAVSIDADANHLRTAGYDEAGDGGGALYKRVGSEPSHGLKVRSDDGAWWEFVPPGDHIDVRVADVFTSNANNTTGLLALRDFCRAHADRMWHWHFNETAGEYLYSQNNWVIGVKRLTIHAHGATLKNSISGGPWVNAGRPLYTQSFFKDEGLQQNSNASWTIHSGPKIDTVARGSKTVTCSTAADAGDFTPGQWVIVHGYEQQSAGNWLPNQRYFDYRKVVSADAGTGIVTLDEPLTYRYSADWLDVEYSGQGVFFGAARITSLERGLAATTGFEVIEELEINGGTWTSADGRTFFVEGVIDLRLKGMTFTDSLDVGGACRHCLVEDCIIPDADFIQCDKVTERVTFRRVRTREIVEGWGVRDIQIEETPLAKITMRPERLTFRRCPLAQVESSDSSYLVTPQATRRRSVLFDDCEWTHDDLPVLGFAGLDRVLSYNVDGISGNNILIDSANQYTGSFPEGAIDIGTLVVKSDGSIAGRVTALDWNGSNQLVITGDWGTAFTEDDTFYIETTQNVEFRGNTFDFNTPLPPNKLRSVPGVTKQDKTAVLRFNLDEFVDWSTTQTTTGLGILRRIAVDVRVAATGSSADLTISARNIANSSSVRGITVDTLTVGKRVYDAEENVGPGGSGDTPGTAGDGMGDWIGRVNIGASDIDTNATTDPDVVIEIETEQP